MILCDSTIREAGTNKLSLIGTFNDLFAGQFPCVHPAMSVYVALTDGRGRVPCRLRLTSTDTGKEIFGISGHVEFRDPTGVAELPFQLRNVRLERPGDYSLDFLTDGELLGSRKLRVRKAPPTAQG